VDPQAGVKTDSDTFAAGVRRFRMSVVHHPEDELLWSFAAGANGPAVSLMLATHLTYCPKCQAEVSILDSVGGEVLRDLPAATLDARALETVLAQLDNAKIEKPAPAASIKIGNPAPRTLRSFVGADLDRVRWRHVVPGLSYRNLIRRGRSRVYLTKSRPGAGIGLHSHHGNELTLVLAGGFTDEMGSYTRGDIVLTTPETNHTPIADDDGDCITLTMTDAPLKFRSVGAGLVAWAFGF
jgi:putative transcriptional regulator